MKSSSSVIFSISIIFHRCLGHIHSYLKNTNEFFPSVHDWIIDEQHGINFEFNHANDSSTEEPSSIAPARLNVANSTLQTTDLTHIFSLLSHLTILRRQQESFFLGFLTLATYLFYFLASSDNRTTLYKLVRYTFLNRTALQDLLFLFSCLFETQKRNELHCLMLSL